MRVKQPVPYVFFAWPGWKQARRLVAGAAADGNARQGLQPRDAGSHRAVHLAVGAGCGQQGHGNVQCIAQLPVPPEGMDVEEHGPGGVGVVCHMDLSAGEVPDEPAVHGACPQVSALRPAADAGDVVQQPADLRAGEIGIDQKACFLRHRLSQPLRLQPVAEGGGAAALPDNGVVDRLAGPGVPQNSGLPLVGDADGGDLLGVDVGGIHRLRQGPLFRGPDLQGIVFHPAGLGIDLVEGMLGPGDDIPRPVKQDGTGAGGALVQGDHIGFHRTLPFLYFADALFSGILAPGMV